tara:strand:- start:6150 stop:6404 length:255 start_codon:yes stop_codon:yes gene_type:complete
MNTDDNINSELKDIIVEYVGKKKNPANDEITVELIVETMADEFPEFLMAIAEENWILGYRQALSDVEQGEKLYKQRKNEELFAE